MPARLQLSTLHFVLYCGLYCSACVCGVAAAADSVASAAHGEPPHIAVSADAVVHSIADRVDFNVSVVSEDVAAERALSRNNTKVAAVRKALEQAGIPGADISTGQFQLQPQWTTPPRDPNPSWRPTIGGFVVEHQVLVHTARLERAGSALGAASAAGANRIGELRFALADTSGARAQALRQATQAALHDADAMAAAAGVQRGRILSLALETGAPQPPMLRMMEASMDGSAGSMPVPIEAGSIVTRVSVQLRVAISD